MSIPSEKIKLENNKTFEITTDNIKYNLIISYDENLLCFEIEKVDQFPKKEYYLYLNKELLPKINIFFLQFESIPAIFEGLKFIIESNNLSIFEKGNNMQIQIINPFNKNSFNVDIPIKEKNLKDEMNSITNYIVSVKNELEDKIKEENDKIKLLEEKIDELMKFKEEYEKVKKEEIKIENRFFPNSNIIKFEDENMILNWFENKPVRFTKLYDSKEKGDSIKTFYNLCKYKSPYIAFIKTVNGNRFGWFTSCNFPSNSCNSYNSSTYYSKDKNAFYFSIDKKEKYDNINSEQESYFHYSELKQETSYQSYYFQFCGRIEIYDNFSMHCNNKNYNGDESDNYFIVENFEAYQLNY